ncbi:TonB-linked SusC/RagA family outer membrane protein [Pontibacter mucosus]|uniref:TonB-linked SusC/RagA family outer membrane protein n=1 Tax=Pontibacter mucosus TaxID=1649266 RepID=A0A2T5YJK9_9BACT|nr:SusC/RagA family TonB-linked outer membrane protein [Pontibacter mucosus]PTX19482.1 TonB-linked SusC/RagA family outer membrane protein [Pontibacter mucosus]
MRKLLLMSFVMVLALLQQAYAQSRTVTGTVTDQGTSQGLPGVAVIVKGTTVGTTTGADGSYSITVPAEGSTLVFRFIGYQTTERTIGNASTINVALGTDTKQLSEVVVTGVGVATERKKVAIAVETVTAEDMPKVSSASIDQALVGKVAGAQISSISGQPGQQAAILLRGINSLGSSQPMILVDGVQVSTTNNQNGSASNLSSRLADLDLSNVERVEVIQGAAAGTIYGAQGANGVIQIFTKKGQRGQKPAINVSSRVAFDNPITGNLKFAENHYFNTDDDGYILDASGNRLQRTEDGAIAQPGIPVINGATLNNKPYREQTYNQLDQVFRSNAMTTNNSVGISGGGEAIDYAVNLSHLNQESAINGRLERSNLSANIGAELFKNFTVRSITQLIYSDNSTGGINGQNNIYSGIGAALLSRRYWDLTYQNPAGQYVINPEGQNSVNPFYTQQFRDYSAENTRIVQNFNFNYKFNRFLELDYKYGIDNYRYDFTDYVKYQGDVTTPGTPLPSIDGRITRTGTNETTQNSLLTAFIKTNFEEDFNLNVPIQTTTHLAYDYRRVHSHQLQAQGTGFASFPPYTIRNANTKSNDEVFSEFITYGYLINQRLDYGSLFGVSGGVRVDYSSAFGAGSDAFVFPRADAYVNVGDFITSNTLTALKLRAAYGQAGIQPSPYARRITLNSGNIGEGSYLALQSIANNANLNVQVSEESEVGADIGFTFGNSNWFNRITLNATYWKRTSEDVIYNIDLAPSSGASGITDNAITLKASGFQLGLDADVYSGENFSWTFGTRFGTQETLVDKISNGMPIALGAGGSGQFTITEGERLGAFFGKKPLSSIDQTNAEGVPYLNQANAANYEVVNGMVVNKETKAVQFTSDNHAIGDPTPKFNMSFINSFNIYRNLSVNVQVDWVYGNDIYNQTKQWMYRDLVDGDLDNEITVGGVSGAYVNFYNSLYNTNTTNAYFVEKGSFARLRDLSVSYDLGNIINVGFIRSLQLTASGRNLFTITNYSGMDPEAGASLNDPLRRGLDLHAFPNMKTIQFGVNIGL